MTKTTSTNWIYKYIGRITSKQTYHAGRIGEVGAKRGSGNELQHLGVRYPAEAPPGCILTLYLYDTARTRLGQQLDEQVVIATDVSDTDIAIRDHDDA